MEVDMQGNMCFRDWEDGLKESNPTIYNEWRIKTMSTKKWKNNELMENLSEKFGFKMDLGLLKEAKEKMPDHPDVDGDGNRDEDITKAQKDKKEKESGKKSEDSEEKEEKSEESEEESDKDLSKVPPQLRKHVAKKKGMSETRLRRIIRQAIRNELKGK